MKKVVRPGTTEERNSVFCKVEWDGTRLSISGVEGPMSNGTCRGGCGQIQDFKIKNLAPRWTPELVEEFKAVWNRWHLNYLTPGCEHQRRDWDDTEKVELVTYRLTGEGIKIKNEAKAHVRDSIMSAGEVKLSAAAQEEYELTFETTTPPDADSVASGLYEVHKRESKSVGWLRPTEHPKGILSKPCPECGYKYGSAWLTEEVPPEVIDFLEALPETDRTPAWV